MTKLITVRILYKVWGAAWWRSSVNTVLIAGIKWNASSGNRDRVTSMETMYSANRPMMRMLREQSKVRIFRKHHQRRAILGTCKHAPINLLRSKRQKNFNEPEDPRTIQIAPKEESNPCDSLRHWNWSPGQAPARIISADVFFFHFLYNCWKVRKF